MLQGPGENAGVVDIGDGLVVRVQDRDRTTTRRSSSRTRARRPASAASSATSSRWARGRSRRSTRCASGRSTTRTQRYLVRGVVTGIGGYGNSIGIPTVGGEITFDPRYTRQHPRQRVLPRHRARRPDHQRQGERRRQPGVSTSARRPAATASTARRWRRPSSTRTPTEKRPTVQVGDPFMEKLLLEACLEVMKTDALVGIQDMGAAGLTCSTLRDGIARRHRHRDRCRPGAAARDGHDAVRDHALGVAGAHAARRQARAARREVERHLRQVGSPRRRSSAR